MCVDACFCTVVCAYFFVHETTVAQHPWLHCPLPPELLTRRGQTNMSRNICACMFKAFQRHYTHSPTVVYSHTQTHTHTHTHPQSFSHTHTHTHTCSASLAALPSAARASRNDARSAKHARCSANSRSCAAWAARVSESARVARCSMSSSCVRKVASTWECVWMWVPSVAVHSLFEYYKAG